MTEYTAKACTERILKKAVERHRPSLPDFVDVLRIGIEVEIEAFATRLAEDQCMACHNGDEVVEVAGEWMHPDPDECQECEAASIWNVVHGPAGEGETQP